MSSNKFEFEFKNHSLLLKNIQQGVWRIQSVSDNGVDEMGASQILSKDLGEDYSEFATQLSVSNKDGKRIIKAPDGSYVEISEKAVAFFNSKGILKREILSVDDTKHGASVSFSLYDDERIFGTGERFDKVNQRGKRLQIYAIDRWCATHGNSYIPIPFALSSNVSAVFFNRYEHSVFDIGCRRKNRLFVEQKYAPLDIYIFVCDSVKEILSAYSRLTGFAPVPPEWSFGTLVCRYHPEFSSKEGVFAMMDAMAENDFPWDAAIIEGWGTYITEKRANLKEIGNRLHSMGKKLMVYEQCGKFPQNVNEFGLDDCFAVQSDEGVELKETRSMNLLDNFHHKKMKCIDLTNPEAVAKWEEVWGELMYNIGADGAKIDFCEQFPDKKMIHFADGRNPMAAHHWYPTLYNALRYKHFNQKTDGGICFSRGGGIGAQRYPFVWAGDQRREFFFLSVVLKAALSLGLSGVPFVSWDMAGYQPSFNPFDLINEDKVFLRGIEMTAFSANIQTHGRVKRPYDFDEHTRAVYRAYAKLHDCLRPYLLEQSAVSSETGLSLMRHLFIYDSSDEKCLNAEDEYMLGCGLLVAPILKNRTKRNVYLPKGKWKNIFTGEEFVGGQTLKNYKVSLEMIPVFKLINAPSEALEPSLKSAEKYINDINNLKI